MQSLAPRRGGLAIPVLYRAGAKWEYNWTERQLQQFRNGWQSGKHIADIAQSVYRPEHEVAVLVMDLVLLDRLQPRRGGVFGGI